MRGLSRAQGGGGVVVTQQKPSCWGSVFVSNLRGGPSFNRGICQGMWYLVLRWQEGPFRCWVCAGAGCTHLVPCTSLLFLLTPYSSPPSF